MKAITLIFTLLICSSFSLNTTILSEVINSFTELSADDITTLEKRHNGKRQEFGGISVNIGYDYYPNKKEYSLNSAIIYEGKESKDIKRRGEYFLSDDGKLRAAMFSYFATKNMSMVKNQFQTLEEEMTELLGKPDESTDSKEIQKNWYNTSRTWSSNSTIHAYLALTGSDKENPNRLRLVLYKD